MKFSVSYVLMFLDSMKTRYKLSSSYVDERGPKWLDFDCGIELWYK